MQLKVLGQKIKVIAKDGLMESDDAYGQFHPTLNEIHYDPRQSKKDFLHTLIHELIHATFNRIGLASAGVPEGVEEIIADNIATAIVENGSTLKKYL